MKWALLCGASGDLGHQIAKDLVMMAGRYIYITITIKRVWMI